jgi:hypothetical protein
MTEKINRIPIQDYLMEGANPSVYVLRVRPNFSPIDVNLQGRLRESKGIYKYGYDRHGLKCAIIPVSKAAGR